MDDSCNEKAKLLATYCSCETFSGKSKASCNCSQEKCGRCNHKKRLTPYNSTGRSEEITDQDCSGTCGCEGTCDSCNASRRSKIFAGACNIMSDNMTNIMYLCFCLILLLVIIVVLVLTAVHVRNKFKHQNLQKRNALCNDMTVENSTSFFREFFDIKSEMFEKSADPRNNIFYVIHQPLSKEQACNVESVLRMLSDKIVFIIEMDRKYKKINNGVSLDNIKFLQKYYPNLNRIRTTKRHFFEGSLFEDNWGHTNEALSTFAAKVLAVWQFGGTALSENLLMNSRKIFDKPNDMCMADKDLVYCPHECSAYTYDLMKEILNKMKSINSSPNETDFEKLIDESINDICSKDVARNGCKQVYRLQKSDMCDGKAEGLCQFIRLDKLKKLGHYRETLKKYCHYIGRTLD